MAEVYLALRALDRPKKKTKHFLIRCKHVINQHTNKSICSKITTSS